MKKGGVRAMKYEKPVVEEAVAVYCSHGHAS